MKAFLLRAWRNMWLWSGISSGFCISSMLGGDIVGAVLLAFITGVAVSAALTEGPFESLHSSFVELQKLHEQMRANHADMHRAAGELVEAAQNVVRIRKPKSTETDGAA